MKRPPGSRIRVLELRSVFGTGGGPEKTILLGAAQADTQAFEVVVCYLRDRRDPVFDLAGRARALGVDYLEIEERHSIDPGVWPKLRRLVEERRIDIVHAHEYKTDLLAWCLARRTGVTALSTSHGWSGHSARETRLYYPVDKWLLARFPRVIAVSTAIRDELIRCGARPERVPVVLNAVDPGAFRRRPETRDPIRAALGFEPDDVVVASVGRVERVKRFDLLVEAMAPLMRERPRIHLVIAGDGSLREGLEAQARSLGVGDRFHVLGHRSDVADLHQGFDLFVQSSESEGTPNAVLEAMAMETPLVATDVGGTRELVVPGTHGLIVPRHDVAALRQAIAEALDTPDAARARARAARRRVETDLSFAARTRRLESIYADLMRDA